MAQASRRDPSQPASKRALKRPRQRAAVQDESPRRVPLPDDSLPPSTGDALDQEHRRAEEALRESEERYRNLVESAPDVIYSLSAEDGVITSLNPAFERITGWSRSEWLGKPFTTLVHPDDLPIAMQTFEQILHEEIPPPYELRILSKSGEYLVGEFTSMPQLENGRMTGEFGIARDITERKRAQEELLRQRAVLDMINKVLRETLTCETDADVARACLEAAEALTASKFGYIGEINQAGRFDTIALTDPGWEACTISRSNAVRMINDMELRGIWAGVLRDEKPLIVNDPASYPDRVGTPEGHPPLTSFLGVPLKHRDKTIGMIALANKESGYDVTDQENIEALSVAFVEALNRKRAEQALRESEKRFRELADLLPQVVFEMNETGRLTFGNRRGFDSFGYSQDDLDKGLHAFEMLVPEDRDRVKEALQRTYNGERLGGVEYTALRKDGSTFPIVIHGAPIYRDGRPMGLRGIIVDITKQKQQEAALEKAREELDSRVERQIRRGNAYGLTFRELTVLHLVAAGKTDREIGMTLGISHLTAQKHVANILSKMGAASRTEAGVRALREGLLE